MIDRDVLLLSKSVVEEILAELKFHEKIGVFYFKGSNIDIGAGIWRTACLAKINFVGFMNIYKDGMCGSDFEMYVINQTEKAGYLFASATHQLLNHLLPYVREM
jgi:hypothetical protein